MSAIADWRDLATTCGQRFWHETCQQERRIRGAWQEEHDACTRAASRTADPRPPELLRTSINIRTGLWETRPPARPHVPHRMGATRGLAPLTAYEASLRDMLLKPERPALRMSTMPLAGDAPRPSVHAALSDDAIRAQERRLLPAAIHHDGDGALGDGLRPSFEGGGVAGRSEYERSLRLVAHNAGQMQRVTAEERRQRLHEGAAGKPHIRDFAGMGLPPPLGARDALPPGSYRPTEADMARVRARHEREQRRLRAQLERVARSVGEQPLARCR
ncbi:hypothetical protein KFE25_005315 [Diacronema lutheri]|uniref:Uncharacterized protein n=2 Tax=Diacronema lutheri TaxID=2081491 RepID=A0A8J5XUN3_DIALT|nr:hypothetical protein KFE25_005315 [Diacronema lutheri]